MISQNRFCASFISLHEAFSVIRPICFEKTVSSFSANFSLTIRDIQGFRQETLVDTLSLSLSLGVILVDDELLFKMEQSILPPVLFFNHHGYIWVYIAVMLSKILSSLSFPLPTDLYVFQ